MPLSFHLPLLGVFTVRLNDILPTRVASAGHAPEWSTAVPPARAVETDRPGTSRDTRLEAVEAARSLPVPADPRDLVFAEETYATVEAHLDDASFCVSALAKALGVSRSNLYRRLEASIGQTPQRLIQDRRLGRAAGLLEAQAGRVGEVAYAVGYRSTAQFSRAFRDRFGVPPSSYAARGRA